MKTTLKYSLLASLILGIGATASAQNEFSSGIVQDAANWSNGLPTTSGNVGIINTGDTGEVGNTTQAPAQFSVNGLFVDQQGGDITSTSFQGSEFISTEWTINGGTMNTTNQNWTTGSVLTLNTGSINVGSGRDFFLNSSTFTMNGGTVDVGDQFSSTSSGGTAWAPLN